VGSKCWISTKAMPVEAGRLSSNCVNASRPPADAPMPTTGSKVFFESSRVLMGTFLAGGFEDVRRTGVFFAIR
jgi:hypothetical protein